MMAAARVWLALLSAAALLAACRAGIKPTVFISADTAHGSAHNDDVTFTFWLSEAPGGTVACTGTPKYTSEVGTMTGDKILSEDASLEEHFYAGWNIKITGGTDAQTPNEVGLITAYNPLTRVATITNVVGTPAARTFDATTTYELTAGTCAAQMTARAGSAAFNVADMWTNCPEGCDFVGPIKDPEGYQKFVSGPIPCTTVTDTAPLAVTLLCPKTTVAAGPGQLPTAVDVKRQTVTLAAVITAAAVGQSFEIVDTVVTGTMAGALTLAAAAGADAYYVGWKIETEFPKASGTVLSYTNSGPTITVAWDEPTACDTGFNKDKTTCTTITTDATTTYTLTADCPAAPKNTPLLVQAKEDTPKQYQFAPGSLTSWDPILASPYTHDFVKCTVQRSADGLFSARVPAGAFTDAGGNPNVASTACRGLTSNVNSDYTDGSSARSAAAVALGVARCNQQVPYLLTSDITVPTLTITASDDNWYSSTSTGALANGDRITFKLSLSEPLIKSSHANALVLPGGGTADGDVTTGHKCANPVSWGSGVTYYLRCNAIPEGGVTTTAEADRTISIAFALNVFGDLAGNQNAAVTAFTVKSDNQAPTITTAAATPAPAPLTNGSFTKVDATFTFTLADATSAIALVPTAVTQSQYPYPITAPADWTAHGANAGIMQSTATNCFKADGTAPDFTVGAGSDLAPTLVCAALASGGDTWGLAEIVIASAGLDLSTRKITVATAEATITDTLGPGQTLQLIARYEKGTVAAADGSDTTALTLTLPTNPTLPDSSATTSTTDDYYVGWTIETELPTGKGIVVDYVGSTKVATIEWEAIVTDVPTTTTYTLTAPCSATPLNTNLVIESVANTNTEYIFRTGYAPTARTTDATGIASVTAGADRGIHGVDSNANFAIECALMRPANRDVTVYIPAGQFSDAAGNPNPASDPFLLTQDQVPPTVTATIYQADGVTVISDGGTTGSRAAIFKIVASEHVLSVDTASGAGLNGLVAGDFTTSGCANQKFWGWKDVYYIRCDWANGATASVAIAANKAQDLAANTCATCLTAVTAVFT